MNDQDIYDLCIAKAKNSGCQKLGFGAVLINKWQGVPWMEPYVLSTARNDPTRTLAHICDPRCVRFDIPSRTESMLGACQHAEEILLKVARGTDWDLSECEIYVAGVRPDGTPLEKREATFTCIRCAVQMEAAGLRAVNVWLDEKWHSIDVESAVLQAYEYATGKEADSA